jgi:hypothetical protein
VEVGELQATGRQLVDVWGVNVGAVAAELGKTGVVKQHYHHVGSLLAGVRGLNETWGGLSESSSDAAGEGFWANGHFSSCLLLAVQYYNL